MAALHLQPLLIGIDFFRAMVSLKTLRLYNIEQVSRSIAGSKKRK
jgi:hypothetical protein